MVYNICQRSCSKYCCSCKRTFTREKLIQLSLKLGKFMQKMCMLLSAVKKLFFDVTGHNLIVVNGSNPSTRIVAAIGTGNWLEIYLFLCLFVSSTFSNRSSHRWLRYVWGISSSFWPEDDFCSFSRRNS